jgi:hypothetical protein
MNRVESVEQDVTSMQLGQEKAVAISSDYMDVVTYRAYLSRYALKNNIKFKTIYDMDLRILVIKRVK